MTNCPLVYPSKLYGYLVHRSSRQQPLGTLSGAGGVYFDSYFRASTSIRICWTSYQLVRRNFQFFGQRYFCFALTIMFPPRYFEYFPFRQNKLIFHYITKEYIVSPSSLFSIKTFLRGSNDGPVDVNNSEDGRLYYSFKRKNRVDPHLYLGEILSIFYFLSLLPRSSCSIFRASIMDTLRMSSSANLGEKWQIREMLCKSWVRKTNPVRSPPPSHSPRFSGKSRKDRRLSPMAFPLRLHHQNRRDDVCAFIVHSAWTEWRNQLIQFSAAETHPAEGEIL